MRDYLVPDLRDRRNYFLIAACLMLVASEFLASFFCFVAALAFHDVLSDIEILDPAAPIRATTATKKE